MTAHHIPSHHFTTNHNASSHLSSNHMRSYNTTSQHITDTTRKSHHQNTTTRRNGWRGVVPIKNSFWACYGQYFFGLQGFSSWNFHPLTRLGTIGNEPQQTMQHNQSKNEFTNTSETETLTFHFLLGIFHAFAQMITQIHRTWRGKKRSKEIQIVCKLMSAKLSSCISASICAKKLI